MRFLTAAEYRAAVLAALVATSQAAASSTLEDAMELFNAGHYEAAADRFQPLAEQGESPAQYYLGLMTLEGRGVEKNPAAALAWLQKAARSGSADAARMLGKMYASGRSVKMDQAQATHWFQLAAKLPKGEEEEPSCE